MATQENSTLDPQRKPGATANRNRKFEGLALCFLGGAIVMAGIFGLFVPASYFPLLSSEFWSLNLAGILLEGLAAFLLMIPGLKIYSYADHGPFVLAKDQPWRQHTHIAYVEFLRAHLERVEQSLESESCLPRYWKWSEEQIASLTASSPWIISDFRGARLDGKNTRSTLRRGAG
jgi:hypothetical protein